MGIKKRLVRKGMAVTRRLKETVWSVIREGQYTRLVQITYNECKILTSQWSWKRGIWRMIRNSKRCNALQSTKDKTRRGKTRIWGHTAHLKSWLITTTPPLNCLMASAILSIIWESERTERTEKEAQGERVRGVDKHINDHIYSPSHACSRITCTLTEWNGTCVYMCTQSDII